MIIRSRVYLPPLDSEFHKGISISPRFQTVPGLVLEGSRVGLGHEGTWVLFLVIYPLTGVEQGVGIGVIFLSRKLIMFLVHRLRSILKGIGYFFALQIKSSSSCFHSTSIYKVLTRCQALTALCHNPNYEVDPRDLLGVRKVWGQPLSPSLLAVPSSDRETLGEAEESPP